MISGAAWAQTGAPTAADLRDRVETLAANPTSVSALIDTGRAALAVGDGQAALAFFTRAAQLSSGNYRIKAGLAAANAHTGRPETALMLFSEAVAFGAPVVEIAADRGLAYDLLGRTNFAQQDYVLALRHREDPEVRRRLALSLAISGQKDAALRLLEDQIRRGDRAGNRARIMVLALAGDVAGATATARATLPPGAAQSMTPFFTRLASLPPGQMAAAANLGRVPNGGGMIRAADASRSSAVADPGALAFAGGGTPVAPPAALANRLPVAPVTSTAERRRPGAVQTAERSARTARQRTGSRRVQASSTPPAALQSGSRSGSPTAAAALGTPAPTRQAQSVPAASVPPAFSPPAATAPVATSAVAAVSTSNVAGTGTVPLAPHPHQPLRFAAASPASAGLKPASGARAAEPVQLASVSGLPRAPEAAVQAAASPAPASALGVWNQAVASAPLQTAAVQTLPASAEVSAPAPQPAAAAPDQVDFSDVVAAVASLPAEPVAAPAPQRTTSAATRTPAPKPPAAAPVRTAAVSRPAAAAALKPASAARTPQQLHPSRHWVQLAVSQNRSAFTYDMSRMRRTAPELFRNKTPHVAPIGNSNRLLVGPFPNEAAAQTFVNDLREKEITALPWTSPAGEEVERLPARR